MESALPLSSTLWAQCSGNKSHVGNTALGICNHISDPQEVRRAGCSLEASHLPHLSVVQAPRRLCLVLSSASGLLGNRAVPPLSRPVPPTPSSSLPQPLYLGPLSGLLLAPPPHTHSPSWTPSRDPGTAGTLDCQVATSLPRVHVCVWVQGGWGLGQSGSCAPRMVVGHRPPSNHPCSSGPMEGLWKVGKNVARTSPSIPLEREHLSKTQI